VCFLLILLEWCWAHWVPHCNSLSRGVLSLSCYSSITSESLELEFKNHNNYSRVQDCILYFGGPVWDSLASGSNSELSPTNRIIYLSITRWENLTSRDLEFPYMLQDCKLPLYDIRCSEHAASLTIWHTTQISNQKSYLVLIKCMCL